MTADLPRGQDTALPAGSGRPDAAGQAGFAALLRYFLRLAPPGSADRSPWSATCSATWSSSAAGSASRGFLNGVALGQTIPGPLAAQVAMWAGYLKRGALGAWLGVVLPARWFICHRDNAHVKAFVTGATAAAGGALSGAVVVLTRQAVTDLPTTLIALVTLGLLLRFKIGEPWIVAAAGALGLRLHWP